MGDSKGRILYGLYAVVVHRGSTLHGGHYVAYVKTRPTELKNLDKGKYEHWYYEDDYCKEGQWYFTSDMYVEMCSLEEVKQSKAYMLFYERLPFMQYTII